LAGLVYKVKPLFVVVFYQYLFAPKYGDDINGVVRRDRPKRL